jgi:hypothetical protein
MLRPRRVPILFSRQVQPACICLPSKIGCQTWTRTKTSGLTNRRATLTPPGNGTVGRTPTCIVPFRRRTPHVFGHDSNLKLVSAAGLAPALPRFQAGHVAATPRAVAPANGRRRGLGSCGDGCSASLDTSTHRRWRPRRDLHPHSPRRQRVAFLFSYGASWTNVIALFTKCFGRLQISPHEFREPVGVDSRRPDPVCDHRRHRRATVFRRGASGASSSQEQRPHRQQNREAHREVQRAYEGQEVSGARTGESASGRNGGKRW